MTRPPKALFFLVILALLITLTGCELRRAEGASSDLAPVELPPTLAPLGADSEAISAEATAIPTVIVEAAEDTTQPAPAPTVQAIDLTAPEAGAGQAETAAVAPESSASPEQTGEADQPAAPLIVDAAVPESSLPDGGPIAANPPASGDSPQTGAALPGGLTYVVRPGDTLFSIGLRYGVSAQAIMAANGLRSELIVVGQELVIPAGDDAAPGSGSYPAPYPGGVTHVVAPGETLFSIGMQYGVGAEVIAAANGLTPPFIIQVGQELVIPVLDAAPGASPYPQPAPDYNYPTSPDGGYGYGYPQQPDGYYPQQPDSYPYPPTGGERTHVVAAGETLFSIAQRYGVPVDLLAAVNGLSNPNQIYVGQVLSLP